jgi:hypothetical protein
VTITVGGVVGSGTITGSDTITIGLTSNVPQGDGYVGSLIMAVVAGTITNHSFADDFGQHMRLTDDATITGPYHIANQSVFGPGPFQKNYLPSPTSGQYLWFGSSFYAVLNSLTVGNAVTINWESGWAPGFLDMSVRLHAVTGVDLGGMTSSPSVNNGGLYAAFGPTGYWYSETSGSSGTTPTSYTLFNDPTHPSYWHDLTGLQAFIQKIAPTDTVAATWTHPLAGGEQYGFDLDKIHWSYRFDVWPYYPSSTPGNDITAGSLSVSFTSSPNRSTGFAVGATQVNQGPGWPIPNRLTITDTGVSMSDGTPSTAVHYVPYYAATVIRKKR